MKNKIEDLRNHLFEQLERLNSDDLTGDALDQEVKRATAMQGISSQIIDTAKVEVQFLREVGGRGTGFLPDPEANRPQLPAPEDGHDKTMRRFAKKQ